MKYNLLPYQIKKIEFGNFNQQIEHRFKFKKICIKYELRLLDYDILFNYINYSNLKNEKYLYPKSPDLQTCIFCLKNETETTFANKPHVIPYFLGNKYLLHSDECDECNAYFSRTLEDALDKYTSPFRTQNLMKNRKKKLTKYSSNKGDFFYAFDEDQQAYTISGENIEDYVSDDEEKKVLSIVFEIKKHRPIDIYKAFMKIFYGLLPRQEHKIFNELRKWIMGENSELDKLKTLKVFRSFHPSIETTPLNIMILRRKSSFEKKPNSFDYCGLISFGNVIYEMPIFSDSFIKNSKNLKNKGIKQEFELQLLPKPFLTVHSEIIDLYNTNYITDSYPINYKYLDRIKNI